jgi:hypothetical protein
LDGQLCSPVGENSSGVRQVSRLVYGERGELGHRCPELLRKPTVLALCVLDQQVPHENPQRAQICSICSGPDAAESEELRFAVSAQQDLFRSDVAMYEACLMDRVHGSADLGDDVYRLGCLERPFAKPAGQRLAVDVLHHH